MDGKYAGKHWAELLAKELDAELLIFARQGISNGVIRLQINEAIKHQPDFVLINATTPDRIEIPVDPDLAGRRSKYVGFSGSYDPVKGLKNFNYPGNDHGMISETIFTIIDWPAHSYRSKPVNNDSKIATKAFAACLYDFHWKLQTDSWQVNSGLWKLHDLSIKFLYNPWIIAKHKHILDLPEWFKLQYCVEQHLDLEKLSKDFFTDDDPGYHTNDDGQIYIKDQYLEFIKKKF